MQWTVAISRIHDSSFIDSRWKNLKYMSISPIYSPNLLETAVFVQSRSSVFSDDTKDEKSAVRMVQISLPTRACRVIFYNEVRNSRSKILHCSMRIMEQRRTSGIVGLPQIWTSTVARHNEKFIRKPEMCNLVDYSEYIARGSMPVKPVEEAGNGTKSVFPGRIMAEFETYLLSISETWAFANMIMKVYAGAKPFWRGKLKEKGSLFSLRTQIWQKNR